MSRPWFYLFQDTSKTNFLHTDESEFTVQNFKTFTSIRQNSVTSSSPIMTEKYFFLFETSERSHHHAMHFNHNIIINHKIVCLFLCFLLFFAISVTRDMSWKYNLSLFIFFSLHPPSSDNVKVWTAKKILFMSLFVGLVN